MINKLIKSYWPILAITVVIFVFFSKLFFPPSLFVTPDYGRSDILHFNIPVKEILSESLKKGQLPFWEPRIGQGFPIFDEGQIGALFLPNIILFALLPFWLAFNLGYIVTFTTAALGTFLLAKSFKLNSAAAYIAAITFSFSSLFTLHIQHYNLIQTASIMPWLFWLTNQFFNKKKFSYLAFLPLVISQQIFTGFPQITFYSLIGLVIFVIYKLSQLKTKNSIKIRIPAIISGFIILGFLIAAIQLNSTYNLTKSSKRIEHNNPRKILTDFPLKPKNLLTILDPYILGNPKNATYSRWEPGKWSVFWESNLYFGIVQLVLSFVAILLVMIRRQWEQKSSVIFWLIFGALGLMLALGTSAPLYPIFSFPVFSYFRVPARFLVFTFLAAAMLSATAVDSLMGKIKHPILKLLVFLLIIFASLDIFRVWSNYHMVGKKEDWLSAPRFQDLVGQGRIHSIGAFLSWNITFLNKGWSSKEDEKQYNFLLNFIGQNFNITNDNNQLLAYAGISPNRQIILEGLLNSKINLKNSQIEIGKLSSNILNLTSTDFITTPFPVDSSNFKLESNLNYQDQDIWLYKNLKSFPRVYPVGDYKIATTVQNLQSILSDGNFDPRKTVILEKDPKEKISTSDKDTAQITSYNNTSVTIATNLSSTSAIVLSDSYYPGWTAKIDKTPTEIFAANINSRAVVVPQGSHTIKYEYLPQNFKKSTIISLAALIFTIYLIIRLKSKAIKI